MHLCPFILIISLSSYQYSAAKGIYKPINPGGQMLPAAKHCTMCHSQCKASRGTLFISPFAIKCAMSVKHSLVIFLFYSTLHWPFCKIMMPSLSAHLLPVSNLSEWIPSTSLYRTGLGEALAVITVGHGAGDRI